MIHYININKKRLVGRNNQPSSVPLAIDFHTLGNIQFCLIDDKNQIRALPENSALTFAGSVKMGEISQNILFLSTTYTVSEDNVINFTVDTYTEPFLTQIKKKNTEINVEISIKFEDGHQKLLLRDIAYANPRVYIEGVPPAPVECYYTKDEVDSLINGVKADIPTKTSELINDSGYITSSQIDFSDYYTKEETDNKLDEKADLSSLADYQPVSGMANYALKSDIPSGGENPSPTIVYDYNYGNDPSVSGAYTLLKNGINERAGNFMFPTSGNFINFKNENLNEYVVKYRPKYNSAGMFSQRKYGYVYQSALIYADPYEGIVIESHPIGNEALGQLSICDGSYKVHIANFTKRDPFNKTNFTWSNISTSLKINVKRLGNYYSGYRLSAGTAATLTLPGSSNLSRAWVKFIVDNINAGSLLWGDKVLLNETETGTYLFEFLSFMYGENNYGNDWKWYLIRKVEMIG